MEIYRFNKQSEISDWIVVNDGVMGGLSEGRIDLDDQGRGVFRGEVSLENNGGFTSVRYRFEPTDVSGCHKILINLRGDGKRYQFRLKEKIADQHAYIQYFHTSGEWQTIEILLKDLYPTFRGRRLSLPNFEAYEIEEVAFLIANKAAESFRLEIDFIRLE